MFLGEQNNLIEKLVNGRFFQSEIYYNKPFEIFIKKNIVVNVSIPEFSNDKLKKGIEKG